MTDIVLSYSGELLKVMSKTLLGIVVVLLTGFLTVEIIVTPLLAFLTSSVKFKTYESLIFICKAMLYELKHILLYSVPRLPV